MQASEKPAHFRTSCSRFNSSSEGRQITDLLVGLALFEIRQQLEDLRIAGIKRDEKWIRTYGPSQANQTFVRRILSMTVGDFTEGVGISQGSTVLDLLAAAQLLNRERDGSNASQWLA
jgi:hypothetical protein